MTHPLDELRVVRGAGRALLEALTRPHAATVLPGSSATCQHRTSRYGTCFRVSVQRPSLSGRAPRFGSLGISPPKCENDSVDHKSAGVNVAGKPKGRAALEALGAFYFCDKGCYTRLLYLIDQYGVAAGVTP